MKTVNKGKLYGVGVGPGDPELITLKALRIIKENKYIAFPAKNREDTITCHIVESLLENTDDKVFLDCHVQMTKDRKLLDDNYNVIVQKITKLLDAGENVVFLTIGDPTVYSTYMYIHRMTKERGYDTEIINGITSFCAAAGRMEISLAEREEELHIIPASYDTGKALKYPGNKILMKMGSKLSDIKKKLEETDDEVYMIENCSLNNEKICKSVQEIDIKTGYMSVIIVKEKSGGVIHE